MNNPKQIVLIDDHQFIIDGIKRMLINEEGLQICKEYNHGLLAILDLESGHVKPDLVITDISMPELDGFELIRRLKAFNPDIKILALTMHDNSSFVKEIYFMDVEGYLLKSSKKEDFIEAIDKILGGNSYYDPEMLRMVLKEVRQNQKSSNKALKLSNRELEILQLIVDERTSLEIAEELGISKQTVDTHRKNILNKTDSKSIVGLIKFAYENDLIG